ncbi:alpha/beta fold hydrolase [Halalkalicoccus ordinarius]|uniref:alpha/beta fold hydrolase n=1 Tax=Halalkalicoccus ordinarius TaxID=3116651 RepID=UPI00300EF218
MARTDRFLTVDGVELHYTAWGDPDDPPIVCVHGLTRVGRDFDALAVELEEEYYVLCPDMPGRGWSEWPADTTAYTNERMAELLVGFCDELGFEELRWIGTSMGGGLGIALAGGALADRITHLVVNDVSPDPANDAKESALERIGEYVGDPPVVDTVTELEAYYREIYGGRFSAMTDEEWTAFTLRSARRTDDGGITRAYDPRILEGLEAGVDDDNDDGPDGWEIWEAIDAELMVVHGVDSEILPTPVYEEMLERRPDAETVEVDSGHAPMLNTADQIEPVRQFLE